VKFLLSVALFAMLLSAEESLYRNGESLYFGKGCNGCHGVKAEGVSGYPMLANRAKGFLVYKLKRFRSGISENQQQEMMIPFAKSLSDADIDALTTFLHEYRDEQKEHYDMEFENWGDGGS
jgi:cytochrome c553